MNVIFIITQEGVNVIGEEASKPEGAEEDAVYLKNAIKLHFGVAGTVNEIPLPKDSVFRYSIRNIAYMSADDPLAKRFYGDYMLNIKAAAAGIVQPAGGR